MATLAPIVGFTLPKNAAEDSFNLLPAYQGKAREPLRPSIVHHSIDGVFSIREGAWKLELGLGSGGFSSPKVEQPTPNGPLGQLYNLADDPAETRNLWKERPEIVKRLTALLDQQRSKGHSRPL